MYLTTEYDKSLDDKNTLPPTIARELYLREGVTPVLDLTPSPFGEPVHFVYLGYSLKAVEEFIAVVKKNPPMQIILIAPLGRWNLYLLKLRGTPNLKVVNCFSSYEGKIELLMELTGLKKRQAQAVLKYLKGSFTLIDRNLDLITNAVRNKQDVIRALEDNESYSYVDILMYVCGSRYHTRERFVRTLNRYRFAHRSIFKYLKNNLDAFIALKLEGIPPKDKSLEFNLVQLSRFLYLEDAIMIRLTLDKVKKIEDLLR